MFLCYIYPLPIKIHYLVVNTDIRTRHEATTFFVIKAQFHPLALYLYTLKADGYNIDYVFLPY